MPNVLLKMAGNRKATQRFCNDCQEWHNTHRAAVGKDFCIKNDFFVEVESLPFPAVVGLKTLKPRNLG